MSTPVHMTCPLCRTDMWIPQELELAARRSSDITFYCPYGHTMHYKQQDRSKEPPPPPPQNEKKGENVVDFPLKGA